LEVDEVKVWDRMREIVSSSTVQEQLLQVLFR